MSFKCDLSGTKAQFGNKVSHSQRKTNRRFNPNIRSVVYLSEITGIKYRFKVNARCMKTVEKVGGFDSYILKISEDVLSTKAKAVKRRIVDNFKRA